MLKVSGLFIYPIKSLGGISVSTAQVLERGLEWDRRWLLTDSNNRFLTQRELPAMALFTTALTGLGIRVSHQDTPGQSILIPFSLNNGTATEVVVWNDTCIALPANGTINRWFSDHLKITCKLFYMPDHTRRKVEEPYARENDITSFSDGYPMLLIGQSSLDQLNHKLTTPVLMNRFRPNIVFTGGKAFEEDAMRHFQINEIDFYPVKPCARCVVTTINQETALVGKEPLKTLAAYRMKNNKIYFGQNLVHTGKGSINVGDTLKVMETGEGLF